MGTLWESLWQTLKLWTLWQAGKASAGHILHASGRLDVLEHCAVANVGMPLID